MSAASKPPVLGASAAKIREWVRGLVANAALMLLENDTDDREVALARASIARFLILDARELERLWVERAQELGASNEQVAFALGLRPQTTSKRYPNRYQRPRGGGAAGFAGWRTRGGAQRGTNKKAGSATDETGRTGGGMEGSAAHPRPGAGAPADT